MQGSVRTLLAALVALVVAAPAAGAQTTEPAAAYTERPAASAPAIPSRDAASVAVRAVAERDVVRDGTRAEPALAAAALGRGQTLMIVGGAALLAGLIIGDDAGTLIAVGGAVVGIYGLYLYLGAQ